MKELSLFSGMGGGIYGSLILGWTTVAYVEKDPYCQKVLAQRIDDGWFDKGDIHGDIADFNKNQAHKYTGQIDILTGGFPCQPFSVAGKRKGTSDERYLFDEIIKTIKIVQPRQMLFENVPGILNDPAIIEIYQSLDKIGYRPKSPLVLGSDDCGNIHRRKRVWIYAESESQRCNGWQSQECRRQWSVLPPCEQERRAIRSEVEGRSFRDLYVTNPSQQSSHAQQSQSAEYQEQQKSEFRDGHQSSDYTNPWCERIQGCEQKAIQRQSTLQRSKDIRSIKDLFGRPNIPQPIICRMDDELPNRSQQLKAIGNGQDPIVMATAYQILANL